MKPKIFLFFFCVVIILFFVIWKFQLLSIKKIDILSTAECASEQDIHLELNHLDKNQLIFNQTKIEKDLIYKFPCIKDINVAYIFPNSLKINVYGRKFLSEIISAGPTLDLVSLESTSSSEAALLDWNFPSESSGEAYFIDDTGFVFAKNENNNSLPELFVVEEINLRSQLDSGTFNLISKIFSKCLQTEPFLYQTNFKAKKSGNILLMSTSPKLVFSLNKNVLKQLASLQLILQKAKIDRQEAEIIDLRFDKPVVQYPVKPSK